MSWYFNSEDKFSSYEEFVKYLKEKDVVLEAHEEMYNAKKLLSVLDTAIKEIEKT